MDRGQGDGSEEGTGGLLSPLGKRKTILWACCEMAVSAIFRPSDQRERETKRAAF